MHLFSRYKFATLKSRDLQRSIFGLEDRFWPCEIDFWPCEIIYGLARRPMVLLEDPLPSKNSAKSRKRWEEASRRKRFHCLYLLDQDLIRTCPAVSNLSTIYISSNQSINLYTGPPRQPRMPRIGPCRVLTASLTLSQPGGGDYAHPILVSTPSFESLAPVKFSKKSSTSTVA